MRDLLIAVLSCLELFRGGHLPMQKCWKMLPKTSLGVI